jgi:oxidoreductase
LTGETGKALVDEMLETNVFSKIVLIGPRKVEYTEEKYSHLVGQLQEKHVLAQILVE